MAESNNNLKSILNINTLKHPRKHPIDGLGISLLNSTISPKFKKPYIFMKYIGDGIRGYIYLVQEPATKENFVCKIIPYESREKARIKQEIATLTKLSNHLNSKVYVVPCIDSIFDDSHNIAFTIFPLISGYKLKNIYPILDRIKANNSKLYEAVVLYIYRQLIKALSVIHQKRVAHQNLDSSSIIISNNLRDISRFEDISLIEVRLINFGLSCDSRKSTCLAEPVYFMNNLNSAGNRLPSRTLKTLKPDASLVMAQRYDIWCCGKILYELLNSNLNLDLDLELSNDMAWHDDFTLEDRDDAGAVPRFQYFTNIIKHYMLVPLIKRKSANYILNKTLIHEKYFK